MGKMIGICIVLIIALSVQTMCKDFYGNKQRQESTNRSFIQIVRESNACYSFNNCIYYLVNPALSAYGCNKCEPDFELQEDIYGGGVCIRSNAIANCIWKSVSLVTSPGQHICYQCKRGYIVSNDSKRCTKLQDNSKRITNCRDYIVNDQGKIVCKTCNKEFTLSEDGRACTRGCSLDNCDRCSVQNGRTLCDDCRKGTIGVYDFNNFPNGFTACLTCRTWQCLLLTEDAQKYCLKGIKHDKN